MSCAEAEVGSTAPSVHITLSELKNLHRRVEQRELEPGDWAVVSALVARRVALAERRQAKMAMKAANEAETTESANEASGPILDAEDTVTKSEKDAGDEPPSRGAVKDEADASVDPKPSSSGGPKEPPSTEPKPKRGGHGRNGAGAFVPAQHRFHPLSSDIIGALCEACGVGRLSRYREKLIVHIKGQPLFGADIHHFEQARCRLCNAIVRAQGAAPALDGLGSSYIRYDYSACAMLLVMHYFAGMPFKRLEALQASWGIPMPDANQWVLADTCADRLFPLYKAIEKHAIENAYTLRIDDTGGMIIEVRREIRAEIAALERLGESTRDVRTGINTTGVYLETEQGKVLLFFTGRHHASEVLDRLLQFRRAAANRGKLVKVSDAASKNFTHAYQEELHEAVCNAHAFLKFSAIKEQYPDVYHLAGEVYKKVFDNDDVTIAQGMSPHERMLYHREHSLPEMKRLKKMCCERLEGRLVEPNSPLWEPITFVVNQWERLTKFCEVPGIPLDTNVVEQMLIIPVRYLVASFNYRTQNGADVGDRHMSLIASAHANGVEAVAYLSECLRNHEDLARRPEYYLPWVYRERIKALEQPRHTSAPSGPEHPLRPGTHRAQPPTTFAAGADSPPIA